MENHPPVYEGQLPYIFVSYAHKDSGLVVPIIDQLTRWGFRVWYDAGIEAGTEWPEYIANHLNASHIVLAFISAASIASDNCRQEITYAQTNKIKMLSIYLDDAPLPPGLQMQLGNTQSMFYQRADSFDGFIRQLIAAQLLHPCCETPQKLPASKPQPGSATYTPPQPRGQQSTPSAPLLKRAFMFLEDGDWKSANEYCEKVLDLDPECAEAYLGKLMVELQVCKQESLQDQAMPFNDKNNFQKAMRFADEKLKKELQGYIDFIVNRNFTNAYTSAVRSMKSTSTEAGYKKVAAKFQEIQDFRDSRELAAECLRKAEEARLTALYNAAVSAMNSATTEDAYKKTAAQFACIEEYKDSKELANACIEKAKEALYNAAVSAMNSATTDYAYKQAIAKFQEIQDFRDSRELAAECLRKAAEARHTVLYNKAVSAMNSATTEDAYKKAAAQFARIEEYKDSKELANACMEKAKEVLYNAAVTAMYSALTEQQYQAVAAQFDAIRSFKDAGDLAKLCWGQAETAKLTTLYNTAVSTMNASSSEDAYKKAAAQFDALGDFMNSKDMAKECLIKAEDRRKIKEDEEPKRRIMANNRANKEKIKKACRIVAFCVILIVFVIISKNLFLGLFMGAATFFMIWGGVIFVQCFVEYPRKVIFIFLAIICLAGGVVMTILAISYNVTLSYYG